MAEEDKKEAGDPQAGFQALLAKHQSDALAVAAMLYQENYQARERARQLKDELDALRGKVPGEGMVIMPAADADALQAYRAIGKPEDLGKLQGELTGLRRDAVLENAARAHGYKIGVLKRLAGDAQIEVRETEQNGKRAPVAYVKDGDGKELPLPDYAKAQWPDFLPALAEGATQTAQPLPGNGGNPKPAAPAGTGAADNEARERYARTIRNW